MGQSACIPTCAKAQGCAAKAITGTPTAAAQFACAAVAWPPLAALAGSGWSVVVEQVGASGNVIVLQEVGTVLQEVGTGLGTANSSNEVLTVVLRSRQSTTGVDAPCLGLVDVEVPRESSSSLGGAVVGL